MAGGGVIGGASAAGLALSPGMVGLLLLAAFGVYYIADNADAIGRSLEVVLEAEATNTELSLAAQAEYAAALTSWWESAKAGAIDLVSAPSWIVDTVKSWANGFLSGSSSIVGEHIPTYTAGSFLSARTSYSYAPGCSAMFYEDGYICPFYCYSSSVPNYHQLCFVFYPADGSGVSYTVNGYSGSTQNWYCYGNTDVLSKPDSLSLSGLAIYDGNASDGARYYAGLMARGESIPYYTANVAL